MAAADSLTDALIKLVNAVSGNATERNKGGHNLYIPGNLRCKILDLTG